MGRSCRGFPGWPPVVRPRGARIGRGGADGRSDEGGLDEFWEC